MQSNEISITFNIGDIIESRKDCRLYGEISDIVLENGYLWYDFTDGSVIRVDTQDDWKLRHNTKNKLGLIK